MVLHGAGGPAAGAAAASGCSLEDPSKKIRKPYTISKSRESWTEQEHDRFFEALQLFDRDWKKIEAYVGSKTVIQIRSHAQKYFLKVQKNGTSEHVPPPRPKRKAAHPYPHKASENVPQLSHGTSTQASCLLEPVFASLADVQPAFRNSTTTSTMSSWVHGSVQPACAFHLEDDIETTGALVVNDCCNSSSGSPQTWPTSEMNEQENSVIFEKEENIVFFEKEENNVFSLQEVVPDFAQVYSFLGSVFDANTSNHFQNLKEMDPVELETVLLLMRNLSINLESPDFETHRSLLSSYTGEIKEATDADHYMSQASQSKETDYIEYG